jgi:hypothetical protein
VLDALPRNASMKVSLPELHELIDGEAHTSIE